MVDLNSVVPAATPALSTKMFYCRLCLQHDAAPAALQDIFEAPPSSRAASPKEEMDAVAAAEEVESQIPLVERLQDLLQVKYEKSSVLPRGICARCLWLVEAFSSFRDNVQACESQLQQCLLLNTAKSPVHHERPGLNGNPGIFLPDEDCIITEVDPEMEYESSEDDFSMESDSEPEEGLERTTPTPPAIPVVAATPSLLPPAPMAVEAHNSAIPLPTTAALTHEPASMDAFIPQPVFNDNLNVDFSAKNTYLCQFCDMAFTTPPDCAEHEARHDSATPYVCNFCPLRCAARPQLIAHIKESHDAERPYVCALCSKGFCRRSDLKKHTIVHTGVRPFSCPICAKSFSRNTNLTKHMRIHSSVKPHVCQRCPRSFSTAGDLVRHQRSHTEVKPFACNRCPASFTRKDKLQLHAQAHYRREAEFLLNQAKTAAAGTGSTAGRTAAAVGLGTEENIVVALNPYGEQDAAEDYRQLTLQQQQRPAVAAPKGRLHTCDICAKSFTRERDLHRHQALHMDTLFTCKQCGQGFSRREKLARHEQAHHMPQHICNICQLSFTRFEALENHLKMHALQQSVAITAAQAAAAVAQATAASAAAASAKLTPLPAPVLPRPSAADMSFYSQMVPTMNLGFYSETRPEDR